MGYTVNSTNFKLLLSLLIISSQLTFCSKDSTTPQASPETATTKSEQLTAEEKIELFKKETGVHDLISEPLIVIDINNPKKNKKDYSALADLLHKLAKSKQVKNFLRTHKIKSIWLTKSKEGRLIIPTTYHGYSEPRGLEGDDNDIGGVLINISEPLNTIKKAFTLFTRVNSDLSERYFKKFGIVVLPEKVSLEDYDYVKASYPLFDQILQDKQILSALNTIKPKALLVQHSPRTESNSLTFYDHRTPYIKINRLMKLDNIKSGILSSRKIIELQADFLNKTQHKIIFDRSISTPEAGLGILNDFLGKLENDELLNDIKNHPTHFFILTKRAINRTTSFFSGRHHYTYIKHGQTTLDLLSNLDRSKVEVQKNLEKQALAEEFRVVETNLKRTILINVKDDSRETKKEIITLLRNIRTQHIHDLDLLGVKTILIEHGSDVDLSGKKGSRILEIGIDHFSWNRKSKIANAIFVDKVEATVKVSIKFSFSGSKVENNLSMTSAMTMLKKTNIVSFLQKIVANNPNIETIYFRANSYTYRDSDSLTIGIGTFLEPHSTQAESEIEILSLTTKIEKLTGKKIQFSWNDVLYSSSDLQKLIDILEDKKYLDLFRNLPTDSVFLSIDSTNRSSIHSDTFYLNLFFSIESLRATIERVSLEIKLSSQLNSEVQSQSHSELENLKVLKVVQCLVDKSANLKGRFTNMSRIHVTLADKKDRITTYDNEGEKSTYIHIERKWLQSTCKNISELSTYLEKK